VRRKVVWTRLALNNLIDQVTFIKWDDPVAANNVKVRIRAAAAKLGEIPTGRPGRFSGTYEKSVSDLPYILAYAIKKRGSIETIVILRVIHTSRDWQPGTWPS
jgi:plasmid stabilization system protein ParE